MNGQARGEVQTIPIIAGRSADSRLKKGFLICTVALALCFVLIVGVVRLFQSLNDGTISAWRLAVLFANIFGCVTIICTLYGRGRGARRLRDEGGWQNR